MCPRGACGSDGGSCTGAGVGMGDSADGNGSSNTARRPAAKWACVIDDARRMRGPCGALLGARGDARADRLIGVAVVLLLLLLFVDGMGSPRRPFSGTAEVEWDRGRIVVDDAGTPLLDRDPTLGVGVVSSSSKNLLMVQREQISVVSVQHGGLGAVWA